MKIELYPGGREWNEQFWNFGFSELGLAGFLPDFYGTGKVRLTAQPLGKDYLLNGEVLAPLVLECCRCLETFNHGLKLPLSWLVHRVEAATPEDDLQEGEFEILMEDCELDFTNRLRETIIFNLPAKPLCRADCKGLCSACGQNLNLGECRCARKTDDPRWDALRRLAH